MAGFFYRSKLINIKRKNGIGYGECNGFHFAIKMANGNVNGVNYYSCFYVSLAARLNDEQRLSVNDYVSANQQTLKPAQVEVREDGISYTTVIAPDKGIVALCDYLSSLGLEDVCTRCGEVGELKDYFVNGRLLRLDSMCADSAEADFRELKQTEQQENDQKSYVSGFFGAVVGSLIGCVAWVLVALVGWYSAIIGVLIGFLASLLYDKFGGKKGKGKIAIVIIVSMVNVVLATFVGYALTIVTEYSVSFGDALAALITTMQSDSSFLAQIMLDLFLSVVFAALGAIPTVVSKNGFDAKQPGFEILD